MIGIAISPAVRGGAGGGGGPSFIEIVDLNFDANTYEVEGVSKTFAEVVDVGSSAWTLTAAGLECEQTLTGTSETTQHLDFQAVVESALDFVGEGCTGVFDLSFATPDGLQVGLEIQFGDPFVEAGNVLLQYEVGTSAEFFRAVTNDGTPEFTEDGTIGDHRVIITHGGGFAFAAARDSDPPLELALPIGVSNTHFFDAYFFNDAGTRTGTITVKRARYYRAVDPADYGSLPA